MGYSDLLAYLQMELLKRFVQIHKTFFFVHSSLLFHFPAWFKQMISSFVNKLNVFHFHVTGPKI